MSDPIGYVYLERLSFNQKKFHIKFISRLDASSIFQRNKWQMNVTELGLSAEILNLE